MDSSSIKERLFKRVLTQGRVILSGWGNRVSVKGFVIFRIDIGKGVFSKNRIIISGENNEIIVGSNSNITNSTINMHGNDNKIIIGENVLIRNANIQCSDNNSIVKIGPGFTSGDGLDIIALEGSSIVIGEDCMFSKNILLMSSDSHDIINKNNSERINHAKDIVIGKHVWFGRDVKCLKGVRLENNIVVGCNTLLTGRRFCSNSVIVGNPARVVRENIDWTRSR